METSTNDLPPPLPPPPQINTHGDDEERTQIGVWQSKVAEIIDEYSVQIQVSCMGQHLGFEVRYRTVDITGGQFKLINHANVCDLASSTNVPAVDLLTVKLGG